MQSNQIVKKYYEYQLTKPCLEGRLEGFKVSYNNETVLHSDDLIPKVL